MSMGIVVASIIASMTFLIKDIPIKIIQLTSTGTRFSVAIDSKNQESYSNINKWLFSLNKKVLQNNINVKQEHYKHKSILEFSINYGVYTFWHNKNLIIVKKELLKDMWAVTDRIDISVFGFNRNQAKEEIIEYLNKSSSEGMVRVFSMPNEWESYLAKEKSFDDIFIEDKNKIINHLKKWQSNKGFYSKHGITYKTGILLYGEAGTGKTTVARAIASHLGYDIHIINIRSYTEEVQLISKITSIKPKSVVLFEDIDCLLGDRAVSGNNSNAPLLGTVLNMLDGLMSPEEVVFISTTNYIDRLDSALVRDGRFDLRVNIGNIDIGLAGDMCRRFEVNHDILDNEHFPINPAYLQNKIIQAKFKL